MTTQPTAPQPQQVRTLVIGFAAALLIAIVAGYFVLTGDDDAPAAPTPTPPIPTDFAPDAITDRAFPSLTYGIHAFLWWNETTRTLDLDNIRLMNFTHVKQQFSWGNVQPEPDVWDWHKADGVVNEVEYRGLKLIARIDNPPEWAQVAVPADDPTVPPVDLDAWGTYCGTLAERYQGRIAGYQVWNEPNLRREWLDNPPNAAAYVKVLRTCADAIHANDPDAVVISAGLAPTGTYLPDALPDMDYLRLMYAAGASDAFDVLGVHAPGYGNPPTMSPDEAEEAGFLRWMTFRHVEDMRAIMVEQGDAHKQIAVLEVGWTTDQIHPDYAWHAVDDEETKAQYLADAYRYAATHWRPWVSLMTTIFMADIEWTEDDEEYWWAINEAGYGFDWHARPAFFELSWMERYIDDEYYPPRFAGDPAATTVDPIPPRETATPTFNAADPIDLDADLQIIPLTDHVFVIAHSFPWEANALLVEMDNGDLVLVDTPYTPAATQQVLDWIGATFGDRTITAINTHFHIDNLGGNPALIAAGIPVYGSDRLVELLNERGAANHAQLLDWLSTPDMQRYHDVFAAMDTPYPGPTEIFPLDEGLTLTAGGEEIRVIFPGAGHAPDNVIVYFPAQRVLFGGCLLRADDSLGNLADADVAAWPASVERVQQFNFDVDWVIPGHGKQFDVGLIEHTIEVLESTTN